MLARVLRMSGVDGIVIDTGQRPEPALNALSDTLLAAYLPLPCADPKQLSAVVAACPDWAIWPMKRILRR